MRPVSLFGVGSGGSTEERLKRAEEALREIERASRAHDVIDLAKAFTLSGTLAESRVFNVETADIDDLRAIVSTLLTDMQRGGSKRDT